MAAQNQHYVPKFILRQFLSDEEKEQVTVYDKHEDKVFETSIKNIMAERRFNDFSTGELEASFEPAACRIEDVVLPIYQTVLENRRLELTPEVQKNLALFVAFQFTRTKALRNVREALQVHLEERAEKMGHRPKDIAGWEPFTEDVKKREHVASILHSLEEFTHLVSLKRFFLAEPAPGSFFCLGDSPVTLTNRRHFGPYGNIGLGVPGIELYMPLAADLMLCAWCPTNIDKVSRYLSQKKQLEQEALAGVMAGRIQPERMKIALDGIKEEFAEADTLGTALETGVPISSTSENMDHYNSLQSMHAYRYVLSKNGDFETVRRHNKEFPKFRKGFLPRFD